MSKYLQKKFALSEQGGRDLTKAIFSCALTNMGLIFPMGILFLFMERLLGPLVGDSGSFPGNGRVCGSLHCTAGYNIHFLENPV